MPDRDLSPTPRPQRDGPWVLLLAAFLVALAGRVAVLVAAPGPFAFDAFQRWSGRDHLLVRDWLPATQAVVAAVAALGGDHLAARAALAVVAAAGVAGGAALARQLGGPTAGWLFVPIGLFGPYLCWSTALYQEGTFLAVLLSGLALALRARSLARGWLLADLVVGLLGLVRYEGWPVVLLYLAWRRSPRAGVALWGVLAWLAVRASGVEGYAPSPVDYADWGGLTERFSTATLGASLSKLLGQAWSSGGLALAGVGTLGAVLALRRRAPGAGLLVLVLLAQAAAVAGWLVGLETAIVRMQVVPGVLLGLLAAAGLGPHLPTERAGRLAVGSALVVVGGLWGRDGILAARRAEVAFTPERELLAEVRAAAPSGPWVLEPRRGLGTRDRHDGCEIVEGLSELRHGVDFHCRGWPGTEPEEPTLTASWDRRAYRLDPAP